MFEKLMRYLRSAPLVLRLRDKFKIRKLDMGGALLLYIGSILGVTLTAIALVVAIFNPYALFAATAAGLVTLALLVLLAAGDA